MHDAILETYELIRTQNKIDFFVIFQYNHNPHASLLISYLISWDCWNIEALLFYWYCLGYSVFYHFMFLFLLQQNCRVNLVFSHKIAMYLHHCLWRSRRKFWSVPNYSLLICNCGSFCSFFKSSYEIKKLLKRKSDDVHQMTWIVLCNFLIIW